MSIVDDLSELERMRNAGTLTEDEFLAAKARLMGSDQGRDLGGELDALRRQRDIDAKVAELDRWWAEKREGLMLRGRYGSRSIPTRESALGGAFIVVIGVVMIVLALTIEPPEFAIMGIVIAALGIGATIGTRNAASSMKKRNCTIKKGGRRS